MSTARPLRLKTEEVARPDKTIAESLPVARLWVGNSLAHLDGTYDYLVPQRLDSTVRAGVRVGVDFAGREVEGLVLERMDATSFAGLKMISSVTSWIRQKHGSTNNLLGKTGRMRFKENSLQNTRLLRSRH